LLYTARLQEPFALAIRRPGVHNLSMSHQPILALAPNMCIASTARVHDAWQTGARDRQGELLTTCALRQGNLRCAPEALQ
jgi:hypothetical protein